MINMSVLIAGFLALLAPVAVSSKGMCAWQNQVRACVGTTDGPGGDLWAIFQLVMFVCINDNKYDASGCTPVTEPALCKTASFTDAQYKICVTEYANMPRMSADLLAIVPTAECTGVNTPECDRKRGQFVAALGCPECIQAANEGALVGELCITAENENDCNLLNEGPVQSRSGRPTNSSVDSQPTSDADTSASTIILSGEAIKKTASLPLTIPAVSFRKGPASESGTEEQKDLNTALRDSDAAMGAEGSSSKATESVSTTSLAHGLNSHKSVSSSVVQQSVGFVLCMSGALAGFFAVIVWW